ncbi:MAG: amidohydrolase family protein [Pyrinomonadaceae bacterium]|nr:amidohydrolase family protein [Pyrinomonadaceae bacterium]
MTKKLAVVLLLAAVAFSASFVSAQTVDSGKFVLYKYQKKMGVENYSVKMSGDSLELNARFELSFIGGSFGLDTALTYDGDTLAPQRFVTKGKTSTRTTVDAAVTVAEQIATVRTSYGSTTEKVPGKFFTAFHPAPISVQNMLLRYWAKNGKPKDIPLLPGGTARIKYLGKTKVKRNGKTESLARYSIEGVMWGQEIVWVDKDLNLIALVAADAEMDRFEAIREGYGSNLKLFAEVAGKDSVKKLERLSKHISPIHSGSYAIIGAKLIGGKDFNTILDSVIVIRNGRFAAVGKRGKIKIPKGMKVFNASGKTILPGLFDMHAHATQPEWFPASLAAGITTMRDAANEIEFIVPVRDGEEKGSITVSPRLLLAGYIDSGPSSVGSMKAETEKEALEIVRTYRNAGFQQIKIYQSLREELIEVVTKEAHRLGMTVTGHIPRSINIYDAVDKGYDQVNHLGFVMRVMSPRVMKEGEKRNFDPDSDQAKAGFKFLKDSGLVVEPTMARAENSVKALDDDFIATEPGIEKAPFEFRALITSMGMPAEVAARRQRGGEFAKSVLKALHEAGVPLIVGTDLVVPGHTQFRELELFVEAGISPVDAIKSATIVPARAMKLDKKLGTIEVGKIADLVIVDGDPDSSISEIRKTKFVIKDGKMFESAPLWESVGFRP